MPRACIDTTGLAKEPPYTICFSNASVANAWRVAMVQNFEFGIDEGKAAGLVGDYLYADANDDPNKQIADIEDLLTKGCSVLVISAAAQDVVDPGAKKAMEMGVPVITLDRDVKSPANRVSYTDGDSCAMGRMQAEWLVEELGGKGDILLLSGMAGASPAEERLRCRARSSPSIRTSRNWPRPTPTGRPPAARSRWKPGSRSSARSTASGPTAPCRVWA